MKTWICILAFLGSGLSACSPYSAATPTSKRFGRLNYDIGQCDLSPFAGESSTLPLTLGPIEPLKYFKKDFFRQGFESALSHSSYSIAERLFNEGVEVLQVQSRSNPDLPCRYFDFLPYAGGVAQQSWEEAAGPNEVTTSSLLGLFTTIYSKNTDSRQTSLKNPTILILDQTQKWTLLHEMSHYFFAKTRARQFDLQFNQQLEDRVEILDQEIKSLSQEITENGDAKKALRLSQLYAEFYQINHELDRRTALEEFTIEAQLIDFARQGRITDINQKEDIYQGFLYMRSNGHKVMLSYILVLDRMREARNQFREKGWTEAYNELQELIKEVEAEVDFIENELEFADTKTNLDQNDQGLHLRFQMADRPHYDIEKFNWRHNLLRNL